MMLAEKEKSTGGLLVLCIGIWFYSFYSFCDRINCLYCSMA